MYFIYESKLKCNTNLGLLNIIGATSPRQGIVYEMDFNSVFFLINVRFTGFST